jgi:flagellar export protein FliJ
MKKFRFTLEAVGTVRQRQEQKAMEHYARSLATLRQMAEQLQAVEGELLKSWEEWRAQLAGGFAAADAARAQGYHRSLVQRRDDARLAVDTAESRANSALQAMLQARQQREIVDKFFEKQKAVHQRDLAYNEQKFQDDLAGRRGGSMLTWKREETSV